VKILLEILIGWEVFGVEGGWFSAKFLDVEWVFNLNIGVVRKNKCYCVFGVDFFDVTCGNVDLYGY